MALSTDKTIHQPVTNCQYVQHIHLSIIYHDIVWGELHTTTTVGKVHIIQPSSYHRFNSKYVGAYSIRPSWLGNSTLNDDDMLGVIISFSPT